MKTFVALAIFIWFACGLAGAWMLERNQMRVRTIVRGPLSLIEGYNDSQPWSP